MKETPQSPLRVVVIGAGYAGLGAAKTLSEHPSIQLTILESSSAIGGRARTGHLPSGTLVELGATWFHGVRDNPVFDLAVWQGVAKDIRSDPDAQKHHIDWQLHFARLNDKQLLSGEMNTVALDAVSRYTEAAEECTLEAQLGDSSVGDVLRRAYDEAVHSYELQADAQHVFAEAWHFREKLQRTFDGFYSTDDVSLAFAREYETLEGPNVPVPGGYQQLATCLAQGLDIHYNHRVSSIEYGPHGATVTCTNGAVFPCDCVIVTASLGVLQHHQHTLFHPPLPDWKLEAMSALRIGLADKVFLEFEIEPSSAREAAAWLSTHAMSSPAHPYNSNSNLATPLSGSATHIALPTSPADVGNQSLLDSSICATLAAAGNANINRIADRSNLLATPPHDADMSAASSLTATKMLLAPTDSPALTDSAVPGVASIISLSEDSTDAAQQHAPPDRPASANMIHHPHTGSEVITANADGVHASKAMTGGQQQHSAEPHAWGGMSWRNIPSGKGLSEHGSDTTAGTTTEHQVVPSMIGTEGVAGSNQVAPPQRPRRRKQKRAIHSYALLWPVSSPLLFGAQGHPALLTADQSSLGVTPVCCDHVCAVQRSPDSHYFFPPWVQGLHSMRYCPGPEWIQPSLLDEAELNGAAASERSVSTNGSGSGRVSKRPSSALETVSKHAPTVNLVDGGATHVSGVLWITGQSAAEMEAASDMEVQQAVSALFKVFPQVPIPPGAIMPPKVTRTRWGADPDHLGSYSYINVTESSGDAVDALSEPLCNNDGAPIIMFAGEATHRQYIGTVHGAFLSGCREAARILDYLQASMSHRASYT